LTQGAERLWVIIRAGVGYDKIDLRACTANDVVVCNIPDALTFSTASAAFLLMQMVARRTRELERIVRENRWDLQQQVVGHDLAGHTLGIIGLGRTGLALARLVAPFQMRVIAYSPHADPHKAADAGVVLVPTLEELLRNADFVSLHGRLSEETRRMLGERELRLMKPTAYLINVARGEMIDQTALYRCLRDRVIAGAGLDVFEVEPLPMDDPLLTLDNVVLTPHWLASTWEQSHVVRRQIIAALAKAACGQVPDHVLNPEVLDRPAFQAKRARFAEESG
jgi:phosphoglycerate dehydrogenase-like enzyme